MRLRGLLWCSAILPLFPMALPASATVEGRVELPKSRSAPVQAKRYEGVLHGWVVMSNYMDKGKQALDEIGAALRAVFGTVLSEDGSVMKN